MAWLRLIRWKNLSIIFLTQLLVWMCIIRPLHPVVLDFVDFFLLALSTILIAAAGYIINDYFDHKIDAINKPGKVVLGKSIPRKQAIIYHSVLNIVALVLAGFVAGRGHHFEWLLVQLSCTFLLWFYSTHFKRQPVVGNLVVALLTALTVVTLVIYEPVLPHFLNKPVFPIEPGGTRQLNQSWFIMFYALFAFLLTWMREVVKDMEDMKGDADQGCVTIPIKWGLSAAAHFVQVLGAVTVICLAGSGIVLLRSDHAMISWYLLLAVVPFLLYWIFVLNTRSTARHYHTASTQLKIIMVLGLGSMIINLWL